MQTLPPQPVFNVGAGPSSYDAKRVLDAVAHAVTNLGVTPTLQTILGVCEGRSMRSRPAVETTLRLLINDGRLFLHEGNFYLQPQVRLSRTVEAIASDLATNIASFIGAPARPQSAIRPSSDDEMPGYSSDTASLSNSPETPPLSPSVHSPGPQPLPPLVSITLDKLVYGQLLQKQFTAFRVPLVRPEPFERESYASAHVPSSHLARLHQRRSNLRRRGSNRCDEGPAQHHRRF